MFKNCLIYSSMHIMFLNAPTHFNTHAVPHMSAFLFNILKMSSFFHRCTLCFHMLQHISENTLCCTCQQMTFKYTWIRGCSHMMSDKNGGVQIHPPPLFSQNQKLAYPPLSELIFCCNQIYKIKFTFQEESKYLELI